MNPHDLYLKIEELCCGDLSTKLKDKADKESIEKITQILEANQFTVQQFPDLCRLDLSATRNNIKNDKGNHFTEYTAIEVKQANFRLRSIVEPDGTIIKRGVEDMRCDGAFIPAQKIDAFGCAASSGYHHQAIAYLFTDYDEPFFIPYRHFDLRTTTHPLEPTIILSDPDKLRREGQQSMEAFLVEHWKNINPLLRHMTQINTIGRCECYHSKYRR